MSVQEKIKSRFSLRSLRLPIKDKGTQALVITNFFGNVVRLLSNLILARFLSPDAFAITGLASTVIFAFAMISDGGFRAFILRHKQGDSNEVLNTLWSAKLIRNLILAVLVFSSSNVIAGFFGVSDLGTVLKVLCLIFVIDGLLPISYIAIERQNKVSTVMYTRFLCNLLSIAYSVIGVYYYQTYWPIVYSMVLNYGLQAVFGYLLIGRKGSSFAFDKTILMEFLAWAKYIIPSSVITLLLMQFDKIVLAKSLSVTELGLYFIAFNFSSAAATFTIQYARSVLQPYISIVYRESPQTFVDQFYAKRMKISLLIAFLVGALSGSSDVFFDVFYDDRYLDAGFYLSILLIMPVMALITYPLEISLILHGQVKMTLIANIIRLAWFTSAAWIGYLWFGVFGLLLAIGFIELLPAAYMMIKLKQKNSLYFLKELSIVGSAVVGYLLSHLLIVIFL